MAKKSKIPRTFAGQALGILIKMTYDRIDGRRPPPVRVVTPTERRRFGPIARKIAQMQKAIVQQTSVLRKAGLDVDGDGQLTVHYSVSRKDVDEWRERQGRARQTLQALRLQAYLDLPTLPVNQQHTYVVALRKQLEAL